MDLTTELEHRRRALDDRRLATIKALADIPASRPTATRTGPSSSSPTSPAPTAAPWPARTITSAADFAGLLITEANVAVVPGTDFAAPNHLLVSYTVPPGPPHQALTRLAAFIQKLGQTRV